LLFVVLLLHILPVVLFLLPRPAPRPTLFPYTTLFRSEDLDLLLQEFLGRIETARSECLDAGEEGSADERLEKLVYGRFLEPGPRSEEHTSDLQSRENLVCRLLLEKKKQK